LKDEVRKVSRPKGKPRGREEIGKSSSLRVLKVPGAWWDI
jgi:hypothetical protein